MLAQIAINIVAHRAVVNRGIQVIVLPRRAQVGIEHQRNDELLTQRVLLGIHAMVGKNLKAVNDNTIGMAQIVMDIMERNFAPVVDDRNKFVGIVTRRDVLRYLSDSYFRVNDTL